MSDTSRLAMAPALRTEAVASAHRLSRNIAVAVVWTASVVILGWVLGDRLPNGFLPGLFMMKINAALGFVLAGGGLSQMARERPGRGHFAVGAACAAAVCAIGLLTFMEYAGVDLGIDQALFRDERGAPGLPGRMAPATAFNFTLIGLALLCLVSSRRASRIAGQAAVVLVAVSSLAGLTIYVLDVAPLPGYTQMALHTAVAFLALCVAILCARPEGVLMEGLVADNAGGAATRRLLPIVIVVPVLLGWLRQRGEHAGLYDTATGTMLFTCSVVMSLAFLVWWSGRSFSRTDEERRGAELELRISELRWRQLADTMPRIVWAARPDGWTDYFNQRWFDYSGLTYEQTEGHGWASRIHPEDRPRAVGEWIKAVETGATYEMEIRFQRASDGAYRWHLVRGLPIHAQPEVDELRRARAVGEKAKR